MLREPLKPMVILGRKIKATESPVGEGSPAGAASAEGCVYTHRRPLCPAWPGTRGGNIQTSLPGCLVKLEINQ